MGGCVPIMRYQRLIAADMLVLHNVVVVGFMKASWRLGTEPNGHAGMSKCWQSWLHRCPDTALVC